jgi:hypothetical protein
MSSSYDAELYPAALAVDGLQGTYFHTNCDNADQWFMLDLESEHRIVSVKIYNRADAGAPGFDRFQGAEIRVGNVNSFHGNSACASNLPGDAVIIVTCRATGRYLFVVQPRSDTCLHFAEIEVELATYYCIACAAGKYAAAAGSTVCTSCEAGKYKAAAGVNIACDQCEAAPRGIAFQQQCWIRMPTGCEQTLNETQTPAVWFVDPDTSNAAACAGRVANYNALCYKDDGEHDWNEWAPPSIVGGKFSAAAGATACDIYKLGPTDQSCNDVCWCLGRSCNLEATKNLNTEQLVRGVLGQLGHSILSNAEWRTDACCDSGSGWERQIPFYIHATNTYYFCLGAGSLNATCAGKHYERQRICACGGTTSALDQYPATYLAATAGSWDQSAQVFQDICGNRRVGRLTEGSASSGVLAGNGAGIPVAYVGGTPSTKILWGDLSVPSTFTICSITRYSGAATQRILGCSNLNWIHGHHAGKAGSTHYGFDANLAYSISSNTNWVVACGRNVGPGGSNASTIINGLVTSTGSGGWKVAT